MIHNLFSTLLTFKNLGDLKPGLNVLLAQKTEGASSKQTRNRAGKTSFIETVHFLTGSEAGPDSIFRTSELSEYTFGMDFDLKDARTVVERSGSAKAKIYVTTPPEAKRKLSATDWATFLGEEMFGLSSLESQPGPNRRTAKNRHRGLRYPAAERRVQPGTGRPVVVREALRRTAGR